jgi:hypothetical protein
MTASDLSDRPLALLLSDLRDAVRRFDIMAALELEEQVLQRLNRQATESSAIEEHVQALRVCGKTVRNAAFLPLAI